MPLTEASEASFTYMVPRGVVGQRYVLLSKSSSWVNGQTILVWPTFIEDLCLIV